MLRDGRYHIGYSHQPAWLLDLPADTFTLTILRDPLRRLQSYYRYLLWVRRQYSRDFGDLRVAETGWQTLLTEAEALGLDGSESLRNLVERAPAQHVLNQLWMFSETLDPGEAAERIRACSAVLRTEYFAEDLAGLSTRLGIPLRVYHERGYDYSGLPEPTVEELAFAREALAAEYAMLDELGISLRC